MARRAATRRQRKGMREWFNEILVAADISRKQYTPEYFDYLEQLAEKSGQPEQEPVERRELRIVRTPRPALAGTPRRSEELEVQPPLTKRGVKSALQLGDVMDQSVAEGRIPHFRREWRA